MDNPIPCDAVDLRETRPGGGRAIRPGAARLDRGETVLGVDSGLDVFVVVLGLVRSGVVGIGGDVGGEFSGTPLLSGTRGFQASNPAAPLDPSCAAGLIGEPGPRARS
jgi:hypothetical protein